MEVILCSLTSCYSWFNGAHAYAIAYARIASSSGPNFSRKIFYAKNLGLRTRLMPEVPKDCSGLMAVANGTISGIQTFHLSKHLPELEF